MDNNNTLLTVMGQAPVEVVSKEQVEATIAKIKVMVPDAAKMNIDQIKVIAQESILFRTIPGKDIHYFVNPTTHKLERVEDYKYLVSFTETRERVATGDRQLKIKYQSHTLTPQEKITEGVPQDDYAVRVTVTTTRDTDSFRREVKSWMDLGLNVNDAMKAAKETTGEIGVSSVGIVRRADGNIPKGWSPLQKAEKLAIKNAIHKRWGSPTVDELAAHVRGLAKLAGPEDWADVPLELPPEAQARWADMNAQGRDIAERSAELTIDQHAERLNEQTKILRGEDLGGIGEDWRDIGAEVIEVVPEVEPAVIEPPKASKPYRFPSAAAQRFYTEVQRETSDYYESPHHLLRVIGSWFDFSNEDAWAERMSLATDHARKAKEESPKVIQEVLI